MSHQDRQQPLLDAAPPSGQLLAIAGWRFLFEGLAVPPGSCAGAFEIPAQPGERVQRVRAGAPGGELPTLTVESDSTWTVRGGDAFESPLILALTAKAAASDAVVLHCSGLLYKERTLLALGQSGAGKSTLATLMADVPMLSDEFNVVRRIAERLIGYGTPLRSTSPRQPSNLSGRLGALLFPVKSQSDFLEPVPADQALRQLAQSAVISEVDAPRPSFALLAEIARQVPAFNFHFRKDLACRRLLDELPIR